MPRQNDVSSMRSSGVDLSSRLTAILSEIVSSTDFLISDKDFRKSEWWKTGKIGAVHIRGIYKGKECILKIQGTKPATSEALMIQEFSKQNESKIIRPPLIYDVLPWDGEKQYEALFLEAVNGDFIITHHPSIDFELNEFFQLYEEYKKNCYKTPWIERPKDISYKKQLFIWREAVAENLARDIFKDANDETLIAQGAEILENAYTPDDLEFMHGHFQPGDLIKTDNGEVILFSNLFWSWRIPFYDTVFAFHWWMLGMEYAENLTEKLWKTEQRRWLDKIYALPHVQGKEKLLKLALLERSVAALAVDRFMMDQTKKSSGIITKLLRIELAELIEKLR